MSRDPVDRVLEHTMNLPQPYDPILNPNPFATPAPITVFDPHQNDNDFKPATGDGQ